ncbi:class B sortase [Petrocella sp. FN5]|uniref:class B sortase n=1 Tax=Petrocella sp. FN5 TaxID=3032002 RepID=UPI0023DB338A|nr:class B sortase [Petrocella sp. FN5]MDF1616104.1 class B sortase [Petrocella sp. FN5]
MLFNLIRLSILLMIVLINLTLTSPLETFTLKPPESIDEVSQFAIVETNNDFFQIRSNPSIDFLNKNKDYVGWIQIENTTIDYPVVKGPDNDFYLNKNFEQQPADAGSIFMDYRNFGFGFDQHTLIYGHNMKNGSMFGQLDLYLDYDFALTNPIIYVHDLYGLRKYHVFSSYYAKADTEIIQTDFSTSDIELFFKKLKDKSSLDYDLHPKATDRILSLITCNYDVNDGRLFVHALEIIED